ncbi:MAG: hypothetical protein GC195_03600 [Nostoc sp. RI_552]|jgi:hypothetical protein|nr:hypothetical protein [Nostoc sp. RI_552]
MCLILTRGLFISALAPPEVSPYHYQMEQYKGLDMRKTLDFPGDRGCDVVLFRSNTYYSLQEILKYIAQNLQHGSIF